MADRRIVVADSDERLRHTTALLGRLGGYEVREVQRLGDLPDASSDGLDLLILSPVLIDGDGVEYASRLRSGTATAGLPILVAGIDPAVEPRVIAALGPETFIQLPARPSDLFARIAALIGPALPVD